MQNNVGSAFAAWRKRLRAFMDECAASRPVAQAARLREFRLLLLDRPPELEGLQPLPVLSSERFEAMLSAGAHESAALSFVGEDAGYMLSRGGTGFCLASVILPAFREEHTYEGDTPALALIGALALALDQLAGGMAVEPPRQAVRLN